MATYTSDIVDLFLPNINDYRLSAINDASGSMVLNLYVEPWILNAIEDFDICDQDLTYTPSTETTEGYFNEDLTMENKIMLSQIMVLYWLQKTVADVLQMSNLITDHDFKTFSAAQNMKAKQDYLNLKREEISQRLILYSYKKNNWTNWKNMDFDGSGSSL